MTTRLEQFEITGLFGLYDHKIRLNHADRITIIIGPNGRGKTVCLKLIEALFGRKFGYFGEIPFTEAKFYFSEDQVLTVAKKKSEPPDKRTRIRDTIEFRLDVPGKITVVSTPGRSDEALTNELRRYIPSHYRQIDPNLWQDQTDGEYIDLDIAVGRFGIPPRLQTALRHVLPPEMDSLIAPIDCHLIETQRLLVLSEITDESEPWNRRHVGTRKDKLTVQAKAETLKQILRDKLTESATLSQRLDRTFPRRVFDAQEEGTTVLSETQLREELTKLDVKRKALMQAGILATDYEPVAVSSTNIDPGVVRVLQIYVNDTDEKLSIFNDLRARVDLFKSLVGQRFIDKTIKIDRESGISIFSRTGPEVPLDKLSSGEQHQLILIFDLLFEVKPNSLILIDEPELSLHVAWQKSFIESIEQIIKLNNFDVLLATHSPAMLARHSYLAVELGPVDD